MPLYHFNIDNGKSAPDMYGTELASLAIAKCEAVKMAGTMICDSPGEFWDSAEWTMTVTDENGLTLFILHIVGTEAPSTRAAETPHLVPL